MTSSRQGARRRPTEEIRALILDAARDLFAKHGYQATRTQDIAERAGVYERLLFTNFGSKAGLFNAAVIDPLTGLVAEYVEGWNEHPDDATPEQRIERLITGLYDFARENRTALRTAITAPQSNGRYPGDDLADKIACTLHDSLKTRAISDYEDLDATALLIDVAGMAFGVALLDDMLIPRGTRRPSRARLADEMIKTTLYGVLDRR